RTSRFIPAGEMLCRRSRSRKTFSANVESRRSSFHRPLASFFPWTRLQKRNVQLVLNKMRVQSLRELRITRANCFSVTLATSHLSGFLVGGSESMSDYDDNRGPLRWDVAKVTEKQ